MEKTKGYRCDSFSCRLNSRTINPSQKRDLVEKPVLTPTGDDGNWDSFSLALVCNPNVITINRK